MKIKQVYEKSIPLKANIKNSLVDFSEHTVSLVAVVSDVVRNGKPIVGYGFNSIGRYGQSGPLKDRLIPRLMKAKETEIINMESGLFDTKKISDLLMENEKPGGHGDRAHAAAAIEFAIWDLNAKIRDIPAWKLISEEFNVSSVASMPVYAAGGYYYPEDSLRRLKDEMQHYRDLGYLKFKMKIGGASLKEDLLRIDAALDIIGSPCDLAVDANGRFNTEAALEYAKAMQGYGLRWYEEPGDPLDFSLMSQVAEIYSNPVATGENLFSVQDVRNLIRYGGMREHTDLFQMDPGLSYGLHHFSDMVGLLEKSGFTRRQVHPHGGHMLALHTVVGLGLGGSEAYPGVFSPFGGYTPQCKVSDGKVSPSDAAGFGLEEKDDLYQHMKNIVLD